MSRRSIWSLHLLTVALATGVLLLPAGCGGKKKKTSDTDETDTTEPNDGGPSRLQLAQWRATDQNNLKQMGLAFFNWNDTYGGFPNAANCDDSGKPLLSWRVMILPYIEQNELFRQFKLDEPWDSPNNKPLMAKMPKIFANPGRTKPGDTSTYYRVIASAKETTGPRPIFDFPSKGQFSGTSPQNIPDGTSNTILIVEAEEGVPWTKPEALMYDPKGPLPKLSYFYNGICHVAIADGSVRPLRKTISEKTLRNAITMNDGEPLGNDW